MYAPPVRHGLHIPRSVPPSVAALVLAGIALVTWAAFMASSTSNESASVPEPAVDPAHVRSVAYSVPSSTHDEVWVRDIDKPASGRLLASFPVTLGLHLRGSASSTADMIAMARADLFGGGGRLVLLDSTTGASHEAQVPINYLTTFAWSRSGDRLAVAGPLRAVAGGSDQTAVLQFNPRTATAEELASFEGAREVAPVGYSFDGQRLFIVVVDQSGSALWEWSKQGLARRWVFSLGPTRDWSLSPDGTRLAFIDRLGAGERAYAGKVLTVATGTVRDTGAEANEYGSAWRPGAALPDFGGPGGTLALTDPAPGLYLIPMRFAPDGSSLAATVLARQADGETSREVEIVSADRRMRLSSEEGVEFLGWVRTTD